MNVVSFGGGVNSTAMIVGMIEKNIPIDLILFADTGAERQNTEKHIDYMREIFLPKHRLPNITFVEYVNKERHRLTLEDECLKSGTLPSLAYGWKKCSLKHKKGVQDKFCNNCPSCREIWKAGGKVNKFIGYDAGEENRVFNAKIADRDDKKYSYSYLLYDWGWYRDDCIEALKRHGIPVPGKSSCFFCPGMKKPEILDLYHNERKLYDRAIAIEDNARENFLTVKGLGRNYSWKQYIAWELDGGNKQVGLCPYMDDIDSPCDCYDGY
jgi:Zn-finger nucleic acid-binding protein